MGVSKLVAIVLSILFAYKALEEAHLDILWSLIYILVSIDYVFEVLKGRG